MKVLIISHNPLCNYNNMGKTLVSLFSSFRKETLCQIYIYPSIPNVDACNSYFRITDSDMIEKIKNIKSVPGNEVKCDEKLLPDKQRTKRSGGEQPFKRFCREFIWKTRAWDDCDLHSWIAREKPSVIFVAPGDACFLYDIAMTVSEKYKIPIVTYLCDDFYYKKVGLNPFVTVRYKMIKNKFRQLLSKSACAITICDEYAERIAKDFNIKTETVMTGISSVAPAMKESNELKCIVYAGNLGWGRYLSIANFGKALDTYNRTNNKNIKLKVYSGEINSKALKSFNGIESLDFCGFVNGEEYNKAIMEADALLFTESFRSKYIEATRYSVSTKIPEYLASGIPIIAYAPSEIASMRYLKSKQCAVCFDNEELSLDNLNEKISKQSAVRNQLTVADKNHSSYNNSKKIFCLLQSISDCKDRING